ncbi:hypothetical protein BKA57DRAFT_5968 [Linnemannia elongata]|nr:hypothetical protein BKA57DRAFT_5968 [Linnemannia elongata]
MAKETTPTEIIIPVDIGQDPANCSIEQLQHQHQHQLDQLQPKNRTTIPAQVMIPPTKAPDHEIGGADNMSQHEQQKDQHKEPLTSVSSPNEGPSLDSKALANVTIADKFKKYPGFIHPYTTYIHDGLTFVVESFVSAVGATKASDRFCPTAPFFFSFARLHTILDLFFLIFFLSGIY